MTVTPYDILSYLVSSESGKLPYLVDLEWNDGMGGCWCDDYLKRAKERKKLTCKHIRCAQQYEINRFLKSQ